MDAASAMVRGGPIDVLTGDYLAELTMAILLRKRMKNPDEGYAQTFLQQMEGVLAECLAKGIKVVSNAGGLNPAGLARALEALAQKLGLKPRIAWIDGDDLAPRLQALQAEGESFFHMDRQTALRDAGAMPMTANAYLGCWGIKEALDRGADIVICPRVTDASVVMGPAAWHHNWRRDDLDALAGALAAGHVIECGCQATGGNYAFFEEVPSFRNVGFPIAEIAGDGSSVITKHPNTGGMVTVGTVTAQILYEIGGVKYLNPDVTGHFDTIRLEQVGTDRVQMSGTKGSLPPPHHKVCINMMGGYQNLMQMSLCGPHVEKKAEILVDTLFDSLGGKEQFDSVHVQLVRSDKPDARCNEEALAMLRIHVTSRDENLVGRRFTAAMIELGLSNVPGLGAGGSPPRGATPRLVYWPALVASKHIRETVHMNDEQWDVEPASLVLGEQPSPVKQAQPIELVEPGDLVEVELGRLFGARSGDKGGNANLGVWARHTKAYGFLVQFLTTDKLIELLPDLGPFPVERAEFPNILSFNFVIKGILGDGVASSPRVDPQAKTLGEYLRTKRIMVPRIILEKT
jgi:hypothetical protein